MKVDGCVLRERRIGRDQEDSAEAFIWLRGATQVPFLLVDGEQPELAPACRALHPKYK